MAQSTTSTSHGSEILRTCLAGASFGTALTLARVYLPTVIMDQMRLRDFHMLEVFLSATTLSSLVFLSLEKLGVAKKVTRANSRLGIFRTNITRYDGNILGGVLIGTGMALAGACPGTVIIQLAQGIPIARITTLGAILGGTAWALTGDRVVVSSCTSTSIPASISTHNPSKPSEINKNHETTPLLPKHNDSRMTIAEALNTNSTMTYVAFILLLSATTAASVKYLPGKSQALIPTVAAGALVALSQAFSLIVASTPLGTSAAYEQMGQYIARVLCIVPGFKKTDLPAFPPKGVVFTVGMAFGSILVSRCEDLLLGVLRSMPVFRLLPFAVSAPEIVGSVSIPSMQALIGGFSLSYGSRMAGGCTSGHGITGLSSLSWASLISVMSMFGGGILVRIALDFIVSFL